MYSCFYESKKFLAQSKMKTKDPGPQDPGTPGPGTQGPRTQNPRTKDSGSGTQDTGLRTKDRRLRTPKLGTLGLWTFLLNFKIKRWKVRNRLQVNVITQSTLSHILTFTYFSRVKVYFWNFQEDSLYRCIFFKDHSSLSRSFAFHSTQNSLKKTWRRHIFFKFVWLVYQICWKNGIT